MNKDALPTAFENIVSFVRYSPYERVKIKDYAGEGAGQGAGFLEDGTCLTCSYKLRSYFHY